MKKLFLIAFILFIGMQFADAQKQKHYLITHYKTYKLWEDTVWIPDLEGENSSFACYVNYDDIGIWGKFVLDHKIYYVYGELQRKEIHPETFQVTYYAKGKLVYDHKDITVQYWETMYDLDSINIFLEDQKVFFNLEKYKF